MALQCSKRSIEFSLPPRINGPGASPMRRTFLLLLVTPFLGAAQPSVDLTHGPLRVSDNRRFLVHSDGAPFFWLGDTAWELFHRLSRPETHQYLENRRAKRFTVIQAVVLAELDGLEAPNAYGEVPLINRDPLRPNEKYFTHVDWVVKEADEMGLYIGMLPTWGNKVSKGSWEKTAPIIFNPENAKAYGRWIGRRYRNERNIIWILGGDRNPRGAEPVWRAMAEGVREADRHHLLTYHPNGQASSSDALGDDDWLAFNMIQSGHLAHNFPNFEFVERDYSRQPVKPVLDGENRYEDHPVNWKPKELGYFDEYDVRQAAYWAVLAGAFGHTYGCHPIWQMLAPGREPIGFARNNWVDALDMPGASSLRHLRALVESRPALSRVPDQGLLADNPPAGIDHAQASRGDGYAFIYVPAGRPAIVNLYRFPWKNSKVWWFDPKSGGARPDGTAASDSPRTFTPPGTPGRGNDWVLVLDDLAVGFAPPGERR
jgi:hypothetical protein